MCTLNTLTWPDLTTYLNLSERLTNCWIWLNVNWTQLTNGDIGRAVGFKELVDVRPDLGHPVDDLVEVVVPHARADLGLHQLAAQVAAEEALHGLHVVGTQHPPETQGQTCKSFIYTVKYRYRKGRYLYILVDPLSYFSFQPVLHDWCNKGCGMCYPVCGMVHIKEPLLLIDKRQRVSFLNIRMVLNHMSDAI